MSITEPKSRGSKSISHRKNPNPNANTPQLPLVVTLSCIEDNELEQDSLAGVAAVEHVGLNRLADGKIESAAAVLLHSLAFLPRAGSSHGSSSSASAPPTALSSPPLPPISVSG